MPQRTDQELIEYLSTTDVQCPRCTYSLRGLQQPTCPECGFGFDAEALRRLAAEPEWWEEDTALAGWLLHAFLHGLWPWRLCLILNLLAMSLILSQPVAAIPIALTIVVLFAWRLTLDKDWGEHYGRYAKPLGILSWILTVAIFIFTWGIL